MGIISSYLHEPFIYIFFLRFLLVGVVLSMHHFQIWTFQSRFPKRMWFLSRLRHNLLKNHIPFENSACEGGFLKSPFSNLAIWLFRAHFQKECGFWVDSGLISSKTMFLSRILLVKVVFSKHQRADYGMWFLSRSRRKDLTGIVSSYLHEAFIYIFFLRFLLVRVVFSMHHFQIWLFRAHFQKECGFWVY